MAMKVIVVIFVLSLPLEVFVLPDVLVEEQRQLAILVNEVRVRNGLPKLSEKNILNRSSTSRASDMAANEYFSHVGPNNRGLSYFLNKVGYNYLSAGENLAMGFSDAKGMVSAWVNSPTHYANLIDPEYEEMGFGLESGYFAGAPTVYVAQHLGLPDKKIALAKLVDNNIIKDKGADSAAVVKKKEDDLAKSKENKVAGLNIQTEKLLPPANPVKYNKDDSKVYWEEAGDKINVSVKASISGPVELASVTVGDKVVILRKENDEYVGSAVIDQPTTQFFKIIISPVVKIKNTTGDIITDTIAWNSVKVISPTLVEKYIRAKQSLSFLTSIFSISKNIYFAFIVFFSLALLLKIFIEIRKQHPHVILQTAGLICLLVYLYLV